MATLAEIYIWFMTGKKPTESQFRASWGSFWHKLEKIPISVIDGLTAVLNAKTENSQFEAHKVAANAHQALFDLKADKTDVELSQIKKMVTQYSGGAQEFTLPTFAQIIEVSINGKSTELYTQINTETVRIDEYIEPVSQIVIIYLVDLNLSAVPYYTQAQVNALIASVGNGVTSHDFIDSDIFIDPDKINGTTEVDFVQGYWYHVGDYIYVEMFFDVLFFPATQFDKGSFVVTFQNGFNLTSFVGANFKCDSYYFLSDYFYPAKVKGNSATDIQISYNGATYAEVTHRLSVRFNFKKQ
ncbi:MAG: hypothetical protein RLZZ292_386 [Bacteroidota bacterium]|jgi:hypothetical protein